tara:strand:- start:1166 stop:1321 length:156 start_codon:yes stop_codon:yes gene_type:complete
MNGQREFSCPAITQGIHVESFVGILSCAGFVSAALTADKVINISNKKPVEK